MPSAGKHIHVTGCDKQTKKKPHIQLVASAGKHVSSTGKYADGPKLGNTETTGAKSRENVRNLSQDYFGSCFWLVENLLNNSCSDSPCSLPEVKPGL